MSEMFTNYEILNTNASYKYQLQNGGKVFVVTMRETSERNILTVLKKFYEDVMNFLIFHPIQHGSTVSEFHY